MKKLIIFSIIVTIAKAQQPLYAQCGGTGWTGSTVCASGLSCQFVNIWYSQCLPGEKNAEKNTV
ncbi:glycoside hydrolase family 6 [Brachionus plicatilis]|uniref:Glycoside hydrolase family 6 n=1 Tax=Brachionus plicatilis TaxID=10195 RepID=A0A3M7QUC4_BRAPC|nr:glycoside hydrolase family 6 [Brachionus plicatilis]